MFDCRFKFGVELSSLIFSGGTGTVLVGFIITLWNVACIFTQSFVLLNMIKLIRRQTIM
jgi:hypothetical protein